jgi:glycosyltransferase involved in cell wall biosynthesis
LNGALARPIRVAFVHYLDDSRAGGSLRVGEAIARHLLTSGFDARLVFAYGKVGAVGKELPEKCHYLRADGPGDLSAWARSRGWFKQFSPDVVHFLDPVYWLRLALLGLQARKVVHVHGRPPAEALGLGQRLLNRIAIGSADARICITYGARNALMALGWGDDASTYVVHNGIDCNRFRRKEKRADVRADLGIDPASKVLGMVCRLVRYRGVQDGVRLLQRLGPEWTLLLCGEGPFQAEIERLASDHGVADRVYFTGSVDDVRPVYAAMDAFLFLARYDSFGLATCEAMACGVPVLGLAADGEYREPEYPLITTENATLIDRAAPTDYDLVEPDSTIDALASAVSALLGDPPRRDAQIRAARRWVESRFSARRQAERVSEIYKVLVS